MENYFCLLAASANPIFPKFPPLVSPSSHGTHEMERLISTTDRFNSRMNKWNRANFHTNSKLNDRLNFVQLKIDTHILYLKERNPRNTCKYTSLFFFKYRFKLTLFPRVCIRNVFFFACAPIYSITHSPQQLALQLGYYCYYC